MTAEQMFKELGYSLEVHDKQLIKYSKNYCGYTDFNFSLKTKAFYSRFQSVAHGITLDELKAVVQQAKELGWLESEQKQETNLDHYKEDIVELFIDDLAMVDKKIRICWTTSCSDCEFSKENGECIGRSKIEEWLKQPYKKPTYKLTQFEYDLLQLFSVDFKFKEMSVLKEMKEKGHFKNIDSDKLIEDILANCEVIR